MIARSSVPVARYRAPSKLYTLAAAQAAAGQFEQAIVTTQMAVDALANQPKRMNFARRIRERQLSYKSHRAFERPQ